MKVELEGRAYLVEFRHETVFSAYIGIAAREAVAAGRLEDVKTTERTTCLIRDALSGSPGDGTHPVVAEGVAVRYYKDPPNREMGRKAALTAALEFIFPRKFDYRTARREFWEAYLNRAKKAVGA